MFEFETTFNTRGKKMPQRSDETAQYTILLCGPFAGDSPTPFDIPRKVDMDSIEAIMEKVAPSGTIAGSGFKSPFASLS